MWLFCEISVPLLQRERKRKERRGGDSWLFEQGSDRCGEGMLAASHPELAISTLSFLPVWRSDFFCRFCKDKCLSLSYIFLWFYSNVYVNVCRAAGFEEFVDLWLQKLILVSGEQLWLVNSSKQLRSVGAWCGYSLLCLVLFVSAHLSQHSSTHVSAFSQPSPDVQGVCKVIHIIW